MIMTTFAKLTDDSRHLIIAFVLIFVLVFVIFALIGKLTVKLMKWEGKKAEDMVHDVLVTGVIKNEKKLFFFGMRKNNRLLIKQSWIPVLLMIFGGFVLLLYCLIHNRWGFNPFDGHYSGYGFGTLFPHFDWEGAKIEFFGMKIIGKWPEMIYAPRWEWNAWGSYIFVPCLVVGLVWFLLMCQAHMARLIKLFFVCKKAFTKNLDDYDPNTAPVSDINPEFPDK